VAVLHGSLLNTMMFITGVALMTTRRTKERIIRNRSGVVGFLLVIGALLTFTYGVRLI